MKLTEITRINTLLVLLVLWGNSHAAEMAHSMERFNKTVIIDKPTRVKIVNHYGDIRIRKADDEQFIYHGVAQSQVGQKMTLDYQQSAGQIIAIVKLSNPEKTTYLERFDLALIVPELVTLDIEIEGGNLSTKGLKSAVKVRSEKANIQVKTSKPVDLFTKAGFIDLNIKLIDINVQNKVQTHKGHVNVSYYGGMPYFAINTGNFVTSNSATLLKSLKHEVRTAIYGDTEDNRHIQIKTDTGQVSLIDLAQ